MPALLFVLFALVMRQAPAPGPGVEFTDPAAAARVLAKGAEVRKVAGGLQFIEGPAWVNGPGGGYLVFSDIPANELKRWDAAGGVKTFRAPSGNTNGNTIDREGRLATRRAQRSHRADRTRRPGGPRDRHRGRSQAQLAQ